ncbi:MAG: hypothetical protein GXP41_04995 [Chloroflexi bacterium]|nr:hypothetical protein [Chloroflexota bacterium]
MDPITLVGLLVILIVAVGLLRFILHVASVMLRTLACGCLALLVAAALAWMLWGGPLAGNVRPF